jgi:adenylosuccinate lyase
MNNVGRALLALTPALGSREEAYGIVQGAAMEARRSGRAFRDLLAEEPRVRAQLPAAMAAYEASPYRKKV